MALILNGKEVSDAMMASMRGTVAALKSCGIQPCLAIIRLGEWNADIAYERTAKKRGELAGVAVKNYILQADSGTEDLLGVIREINEDPCIHGALLFRPLPARINDTMIREALSRKKDIDGITDGSLAGVFTGAAQGFPPCTAEACMEILSHYHIDPAGKRVVVIGRSLVIGRPVAMMLMHKNATITICHTKTRDLPSVVREADIVIVAAGNPESIGGEYLREGQVIIDVGIHVKTGGAITGDVKFAEAEKIAAAVTPVPGGVGTVTTSVLVKHVVEAAEKTAANRKG
jgi:methylenetetrahydrofolate dehydrogenase (NADP+)/methenyltetrahydrofolate cyclohydrolase